MTITKVCTVEMVLSRINILARNLSLIPDEHFGHILFLPGFLAAFFGETAVVEQLFFTKYDKRKRARKFKDFWT